jgi:hypothetical protein
MDAFTSAKKEVMEEVGSVPPHTLVDHYVYEEGRFRYTTFIAKVSIATAEAMRFTLNWENDDTGWFTEDELADLDLHFGVVEVLAHIDPFGD